jgi:hypothetical protein
MIRHYIYFPFVLVFLTAGCSNPGTKPGTQAGTTHAGTDTTAQALTVSQLLEVAGQNVNKPVTIKGTVTHTCRHSGKRCFIMDTTGKQSIRIEAKGNIGGFNQELAGSEIMVNGTLREKRLNVPYIDEWEKKTIAEKEKAEDSGEHCDTELSNIKEMRGWMKAHNKNYYSIYFVDGNDYTVVE